MRFNPTIVSLLKQNELPVNHSTKLMVNQKSRLNGIFD